jgi:hypothetical protein
MAVKTLENEYEVGENPLNEFKIDKDRKFVRGNAGPYKIRVNGEREVFIAGKSEETGRDWSAKYLDNRFLITVHDGDKRWTWPVYIVDKDVRFSELPLIEKKIFEKKVGKTEGDYISIDDVRKALSLYEQGELHLADRNKALEKVRFENIRGIERYSAEIIEAGELFDDAQKLKTHPEVLKLAKEKGLIEEKPVMTEGAAQVLTAIDYIAKSGKRVTAVEILECLKKQIGVEPGPSELGDLMKMGMLLGEIDRAGYVQMTEKGRELTDFGRKELEEYNKRKSSYVV